MFNHFVDFSLRKWNTTEKRVANVRFTPASCYEKISNDAAYNYRLDVNGLNSIYLNDGDFELKDGRISFEKDGTFYYFTNFRLTDISK